MSRATRARNRGPFAANKTRTRVRQRVFGKRRPLPPPEEFDKSRGVVDLIFDSILNPIDGYGSFAEQVALHLDKYIKVAYVPFGSINPRWQELSQPRTRALIGSHSQLSKAYLGCFAPGPNPMFANSARRAKHKYLYVFWESSKAPKLWKKTVDLYDKLFVPCEYIKRAFEKLNLSVPVEVITPGINGSLWPFIKREKNRPFRFLLQANAGYYDPRKNYQAGVEAFLKAFKGKKNVELVIKATLDHLPPPNILAEENVHLDVRHLSQKELLPFLSEVDCYLCPTKGEGYNLVARETMATGMPVVGAAYGGMESIFLDGYNYPVDYEIEKCSYGTARFSPGVSELLMASNAGSNDFGEWCNPSVEDMALVMKHVVRNKKEVMELAEEGSRWVHENENYDLTAKQLLKAMGFLSPTKNSDEEATL